MRVLYETIMAEAQGTFWSNEDRYVSRMNVRHEKRLKKQLASLERERTMKTKSLDADKRNFEEKIHRLNMDPADRAHLSRDANSMIAGDKNKELDRLLKSLMHRPYETRAGYSYIDYLSKNMQPLVKRPLQWGINPSLAGLQKKESSFEQLKKPESKNQLTFLTQIEGQPLSLRQRASIPFKGKTRENSLVLPPIVNTVKLTKRPSPGPEKSPSPRIVKAKETLRVDKLQSERRKSKPKEQKVEKKGLASMKPAPQKSEVFVTMTTLQVPTPNYPPFVDVPEFPPPTEEEYTETVEEIQEKEEATREEEEVKVGRNSQSNYTISLMTRYSNRRKSI